MIILIHYNYLIFFLYHHFLIYFIIKYNYFILFNYHILILNYLYFIPINQFLINKFIF
jgi:hypothetical protein